MRSDAATVPALRAVALLGVAMAWGVEREGVTCAEAWGWLGLAILALHLVLVFWPSGPYTTQGMWWSPSDLHTAEAPIWTLREGLVGVWLEVPRGLRTLGLAALSVALFRPQMASTVENMTREGIDMVLAMDLSGSMLSKDFKPNRLESAKEVAMEFVDSRPFDRIGVVAYEGEAFTSVPITTDHIVVKNGLDQLNTGQLQGGTAIGTGLYIAYLLLAGVVLPVVFWPEDVEQAKAFCAGTTDAYRKGDDTNSALPSCTRRPTHPAPAPASLPVAQATTCVTAPISATTTGTRWSRPRLRLACTAGPSASFCSC